MDLKINSRKNLFGFGKDVTLEANSNTKITAANLSAFTSILLTTNEEKEIFPNVIFSNSSPSYIANIRGRPRESFSETTLNKPHSGEEELFYLEGHILSIPPIAKQTQKDKLDLKKGSQNDLGFMHQVSTKFMSYEHKSIVHSFQNLSKGALKAFDKNLSTWNVTRLFPLSIEQIRLGLEFYKVKDFGAMLGMTPTVNCRFYLELSLNNMKLMLSEGQVANRHQIGKQSIKIIHFLSSGLGKSDMHHDLVAAFNNLAQKEKP